MISHFYIKNILILNINDTIGLSIKIFNYIITLFIIFKTCSRCNNHKNIDDFHILKSGKFGKNSICIDCRKTRKDDDFYKEDVEVMCTKCNLLKKSSEFYKSKTSKKGYQTYCKDCQRRNIVISGSKIDNFINILYKRFIKKHSNKQILFTQSDILKKYNEQEGRCIITGHNMTHQLDNKSRVDSIWNMSIMCSDEFILDYSSFSLVINMVYSVKKIYNLDNENILETYKKLITN